jgi:hypothetical protein
MFWCVALITDRVVLVHQREQHARWLMQVQFGVSVGLQHGVFSVDSWFAVALLSCRPITAGFAVVSGRCGALCADEQMRCVV